MKRIILFIQKGVVRVVRVSYSETHPIIQAVSNEEIP